MTDKCAVCDRGFKQIAWGWTDTHGVAVCYCGTPHRLFHYDDERNRLDLPPSLAVKPEWVPIARKYYAETKRRVFPAAYDFMGGRGGRSYSGASQEDIGEWEAYLNDHESELPVEQEESA